MTPAFKPGDQVRVTEACPYEGFVGVEGITGALYHDSKGEPFTTVDTTAPGICGPLVMPISWLEPAPASSPDTPEAGAAGERTDRDFRAVGAAGERDGLRAELSGALRQHFTDTVTGMAGKPFAQTGVTLNPEVFDGYAASALPIIDRHTAKAISHAVMAEREACARVAEAMPKMIAISPAHARGLRGSDVAEAIRAQEKVDDAAQA